MEFIKTNVNPRQIKVNDCVIRAISIATDKTWKDVYYDLVKIGAELYMIAYDKQVYERYLKELVFTKHKMPKKDNGKRFTIKEFADLHPNDAMIITIANHMTYVESDRMYDLWDCSRKSICNYWTKFTCV